LGPREAGKSRGLTRGGEKGEFEGNVVPQKSRGKKNYSVPKDFPMNSATSVKKKGRKEEKRGKMRVEKQWHHIVAKRLVQRRSGREVWSEREPSERMGVPRPVTEARRGLMKKNPARVGETVKVVKKQHSSPACNRDRFLDNTQGRVNRHATRGGPAELERKEKGGQITSKGAPALF